MYNFGVWMCEFGFVFDMFCVWEDVDFVVDFGCMLLLFVFGENDGNVVVIVELFYGYGW